jgi:hypothetical protein
MCNSVDGNTGDFLKMLLLLILSCKLPLLMEDVPPETRHGIVFQCDGVPQHFGHQITSYLNSGYENHRIGRCPISCLPRFLDLTPIDFYMWHM